MNERVKILWAKAAESNFGDSWEEQTILELNYESI